MEKVELMIKVCAGLKCGGLLDGCSSQWRGEGAAPGATKDIPG